MIGDDNHINLSSIEGEELSAVCFVRDYIELNFDGPVVRLLGDVCVLSGEYIKDQMADGFRDLLCKNIGRRVSNVSPTGGNQLVLTFDGNHIVKVGARGLGEEFVHFISFPEKRTQIWEAN